MGFLHWVRNPPPVSAMPSRCSATPIWMSHRPTAGLSPATQQIIEIALALAIGCRVLVLDEPTCSLTRKDVQAMFEMIRRLKAQGHAIVYISHFLEEVRAIADSFTVLRDGKTVGGGDAPSTPPDKMVELMVGRSVDTSIPAPPAPPAKSSSKSPNSPASPSPPALPSSSAAAKSSASPASSAPAAPNSSAPSSTKW